MTRPKAPWGARVRKNYRTARAESSGREGRRVVPDRRAARAPTPHRAGGRRSGV